MVRLANSLTGVTVQKRILPDWLQGQAIAPWEGEGAGTAHPERDDLLEALVVQVLQVQGLGVEVFLGRGGGQVVLHIHQLVLEPNLLLIQLLMPQPWVRTWQPLLRISVSPLCQRRHLPL